MGFSSLSVATSCKGVATSGTDGHTATGGLFLHVRHHHRTHYYTVYECYSPVGGTIIAFYSVEYSEQRAEIWSNWPMISAASMAKAVEALAVYDI